MAGLFGNFMTPENQGLLGMSASLLQSGGPSRMPVSFGQALGGGLLAGSQQYQQAQQFDFMNQMKQAQMGKLQGEAQKLQQINAYAQTLPEKDRPLFLADPGAYIKSKSETSNPFSKVDPKDYTSESITKFNETKNFADLVPVRRREVSPAGQVFDPYAVKPGEVLPNPNQPFSLSPNGIPLPNLPYQQFAKDKAKAGAATIDARVGQGLAGNVKDIVAGTHAAAVSAVDSLSTIGNIEKAVNSGNVNLGPGATVRNKVDQVAQWMGVGGKDTEERLINTRNVIRGLAQSTVNARKALKGQGTITEGEGKLLARAEAGDIDEFTVPELKDFLKLSRRMAEKAYGEHKRILGVMAKDENARGLVPFYEVPDPRESDAEFQVSSDTLKLIDKYAPKRIP